MNGFRSEKSVYNKRIENRIGLQFLVPIAVLGLCTIVDELHILE